MASIEAIYQDGVFKPVGPVDLPDNLRVQIDVQPLPDPDAVVWLDQLRQTRARLQAQYGHFPDTTPDIAEDRMRDG